MSLRAALWGAGVLLGTLVAVLFLALPRFSGEAKLEQKPPAPTYRLVWLPCRDTGDVLPDVDCARLLTSGDTFELDVAVLRYTESDKQASPLVYLQGGPGLRLEMDKAALVSWRHFRDYAGLKRDLILINRRGTGPRAPWQCPAYESLGRELLEADLTLAQEWARGRKALDDCLAELAGFNPKALGTQHSVQDIKALVSLLGLDAWHLLGVSYGTRLGLALADAPGLQSMVLDSVYPPAEGGVSVWPQTLAGALEQFAAACASEASCAEQWHSRFPDLALDKDSFLSQLYGLLDELARMPMRVDVRVEGLPKRVLVNDNRFLAAVFAASYHHRRWSALVAALADGRARERKAVAALMDTFVQQALSDSVNTLTFLAVDCRDNPVGQEAAYNRQVARYPELAAYTQTLWRDQICHQWPAAKPPVLPDLSHSRARVMLLSGEFDPITPPQWSASLQRVYPQIHRSEFPATGHHILGARPCALAQLEDFISARRERIVSCAE